MPNDKEYYERKIKVEFTFSVHQLKILLEATSYFLDGIEDDEEHEFKANKVDVAELNKTLERIVKRDWQFYIVCYNLNVGWFAVTNPHLSKSTAGRMR